jgi:hypothetical protein
MKLHQLREVVIAALESSPDTLRVQDFEDPGICSASDGAVLVSVDGSEFLVTIAQTRHSPAAISPIPAVLGSTPRSEIGPLSQPVRAVRCRCADCNPNDQ